MILEDPVVRVYEGWAGDADEVSEEPVEEANMSLALFRRKSVVHSTMVSAATQAFVEHIRQDMALASEFEERHAAPVIPPPPADYSYEKLPRIRVDLSELYVLDDGVEEFFVHRSSTMVKDQKKRILVVLGGDPRLNTRISKFLNTTEATVVETDSDGPSGNPVHEQIVNNGPFEMAVVALSPDCWIRSKPMARRPTCPVPRL